MGTRPGLRSYLSIAIHAYWACQKRKNLSQRWYARLTKQAINHNLYVARYSVNKEYPYLSLVLLSCRFCIVFHLQLSGFALPCFQCWWRHSRISGCTLPCACTYVCICVCVCVCVCVCFLATGEGVWEKLSQLVYYYFQTS